MDIYIGKNNRQRETLGIYLDGETNSWNLDRQKLRKAMLIRNNKEDELLEQEHNFCLSDVSGKIVFLDYFVVLSEKKSKNWVSAIQQLKEFFKSSNYSPMITFKEINYRFCMNFADYLKENLKDITAKSYFIIFQACIHSAMKDKLLKEDPTIDIRIKVAATNKDYLTPSEIKQLMDTDMPYRHIKNAFLFSCFCGLRLGDIILLKFSDIQDNIIRIIQDKTKEPVVIPLSENAVEIVNEQAELSINEMVFNLPSKSWIAIQVKIWILKAGIKKKITFHNSRHTFGTLLRSSNTRMGTIKELMGHRSIRVTENIYAKLTEEKKIEAINNLPRI